jgi:perosamine synthetase
MSDLAKTSMLESRNLPADEQTHSIPVAEPLLNGNELRYVTECIETSWISSIGSYVNQFEEVFADFCETDYGITVCNGTAALHLALMMFDIGPGDEVIVPALTFVATANSVRYTGATPVFADIDPDTWTIDPASIAERITPRTKAIMPVHLYGHPADMDPIMELAHQHNLWVVEDAAEAHGARYKGRRVGSLGHIGCFSFYGNKIITTGEGGMLTTNDSTWDEKARLLRDHGMSKTKRYFHSVIGCNYRMTNIQAAIGVAQLEQVDDFLARRKRISDIYTAQLKETPGLVLPPVASWAEPVCWLYSILMKDKSRDEVVTLMAQENIDTRPFFIPMTVLPPYQKNTHPCPVSEDISARGLNLPSSTGLTDQEVIRVGQKLRRILV